MSEDLDAAARQRCSELVTPSPYEVEVIPKLNQLVPSGWAPGLQHSVSVNDQKEAVSHKPMSSPADHPGVLLFHTDLEFGSMVCISYHRIRGDA